MPIPLSEEQQIESYHNLTRQMLREKKSDDDILAALKKEGLEEHYAEIILQNVRNDQSDRHNFRKLIFGGSFMVIGGIVLNVLSYTISAQRNALFFYLWWGIVVFGISLILRAFIYFRKN